MRCCYFVLAHRNPGQVTRLVRAILSTSDTGWVYVLQDCRAPALAGQPGFSDSRIVTAQTRAPVERARFSMVEATLDGLRQIRSLDPDCEWVVFLSGQDFPLRPCRDIERDLCEAPVDAFLQHWRVGDPSSPWRPRQGGIRYHYQYRRFSDWCRPLLSAAKWTHNFQRQWRMASTFGADLGALARDLPFGPDLVLHGGSQWCYLTRRATDYLLEFCANRPDVVDHYRRTLVPDESLVHTCLANAPAGRIRLSNARRRFISPFDAGGHPRVLTVADEPALLASGCDFARKFDIAVDEVIVRHLEDRLTGRARGPMIDGRE